MKIYEGDRFASEKRLSAGTGTTTEIWKKACECAAPSAAGDIRIEAQPHSQPGAVIFVTTYTPGPVCSKCRRAWRRLNECA